MIRHPPHLLMHKQLHIYYSGAVQGIGFRFTAENIAGRLGVSGWVKNLHDGRVEILAEGEEESLKGLLEELSSCFSRYIRQADTQWNEPANRFKDFRIEF